MAIFFKRQKNLAHRYARISITFARKHVWLFATALVIFAGLLLFMRGHLILLHKTPAANGLAQSPFGSSWLDPNFNWRALDPATYQAPDKVHPRGLNLVFVSDDFAVFDEFKQSVGNIMNSFKTTEPWKSYDGFNVFLIFNRDNAICQVDHTNEYVPLLKCSKKLIALAQALPLVKLKVIVVSRKNFVSWANLTRFDNSFVF